MTTATSDAASAEAELAASAEWDAYVTKVLASAHEQPTRPGVAVAEFAAEADCELSLAEGERVQIVDGVELAGGWAVALKAAADGAITAKGLVPATYIDLDAAAPPTEAAAADAEEEARWLSYVQPQLDDAAEKPTLEALVLADFQPEGACELRVTQGERVAIVDGVVVVVGRRWIG